MRPRKLIIYLCLLTTTILLGSISQRQSASANSEAGGNIYTVNTLADGVDASFCTVSNCSLREAILEANGSPGADTIRFGFTVPVTLQPDIPLPAITDPVTIDGITGTNSTCATLSDPADLNITVSGLLADNDGFVIGTTGSDAAGSHIYGLNIIKWDDDGIWVVSDDVEITCNHIGIDNDGEAAPNEDRGIRVDGDDVLIGGHSTVDRNVISGNWQGGVIVWESADGTIIFGNYVGTDLTGTSAVPNGTANDASGIILQGDNGWVGGLSSGSGNLISGNRKHGIEIYSDDDHGAEGNRVGFNYIGTDKTGTNPIPNERSGVWMIDGSIDNTVGLSEILPPIVAYNNVSGIGYSYYIGGTGRGNLVRYAITHDNGWVGLAAGDNFLSNDPANLINYVTIESAFTSGAVNGRVVNAEGDYLLDFYQNDSCDWSGYGEGEEWLESATVTIPPATTFVDFTVTLSNPPTAGKYLVATGTWTSGDGNTSSYSRCFQVLETTQTPLEVDSLGDGIDVTLGDGVCADGLGNCTLRAAIMEVNAQLPGAVPLRIDIGVAGLIRPNSSLPTITNPVTIDAILTNDGAHCPTGYNAGNLLTRLDGNNIGGGVGHGLTFGAGSAGSSVHGLSVTRFPEDGIHISADNITATCNFVGIGLNGNSNSNGNGGNGITVDGDDNLIGGIGASVRNLISDNGNHGIAIDNLGFENTILGNLIGFDATGMSAAGNTANAINVDGANNVIGGTAPGAGNLIGKHVFGILISGTGRQANEIYGNWIGVRADGMAHDDAASGALIYIGTGADDTTIGGNTAAHGNLLGRASSIGGIWLSDVFDTKVRNNRIGVNDDGSDADSMGYGVWLNDAHGTVINTNTIAFMQFDAVAVDINSLNNSIGVNSIYDNGGLGIDLNDDGVTPNDGSSDTDSGANTLLNYPDLDGAFTNGLVKGSADTTPHPSGTFRIDIYQSDACDPSGYGEGQTWLGSDTIDELSPFVLVLDTLPTLGKFVTATLTDDDGNTSEFSQCVEVTDRVLIVESSGDGNVGDCTEFSAPPCSLRRAINLANADPVGPVYIDIAVLATTVTIEPNSPLPTIMQQIIIEEVGGAIECPDETSHGVLYPQIDGTNQGSGNGLHFGAGSDGSLVRGLSLTNFPEDGLHIESGVANVTVGCNLIGVSLNGTAAGNTDDGIEINGDDHTIGGDAGLNWLMHNGDAGIVTDGFTHVVEGNRVESNDEIGIILRDFGTAVYSNTVKLNGSHGMWLDEADSADIWYNTIDDNRGAGIRNETSDLVTIRENTIINNDNTGIALLSVVISNNIRLNHIGIDNGTPAGNGLHGIHIDALASQIWVDENTVAHNTRNGIRVDSTAVNNEFSENSIFSNGWIGIDLGENGVTVNDVGDGDVGANLLQNYAVITSADSTTGEIGFDLDTNNGNDYRVEFYSNSACHTSGHGQGQTYLGATVVTTGAGQSATFGAGAFAFGDHLTTIVTQIQTPSRGNTSEFSPCFELTVPTAVSGLRSAISHQQWSSHLLNTIVAILLLLMIVAVAPYQRNIEQQTLY